MKTNGMRKEVIKRYTKLIEDNNNFWRNYPDSHEQIELPDFNRLDDATLLDMYISAVRNLN